MASKITIKFDESLSEAKLDRIRSSIRKLLRGDAVNVKLLRPHGGTVGIVPRVTRNRKPT